jgi:hypothetical protein
MRKLSLRVFRYHRQTAIISDEGVPSKLVTFVELSLTPEFEFKGTIICLSSIDLARETIQLKKSEDGTT